MGVRAKAHFYGRYMSISDYYLLYTYPLSEQGHFYILVFSTLWLGS